MDYKHYFENALTAGRSAALPPAVINRVLLDVAKAAVEQTDYLLQENKKDLQRMDSADPKYDRLTLTADRIKAIAADMENVAGLDSPLGRILSDKTLPNGLQIKKVRVPLGVVGVIYEARPNVTFDVFALCFKTGNISILKGGSDADFSNRAIIKIIHGVLAAHGIDVNFATLLPVEREATEALLNAVGYVDVLIPRGSQNLINYVRSSSKVPVIETGAGIVHTYFDETGDLEKAVAIIDNAKTRRVSVCNALDCLIINSKRLGDLIHITEPLAQKQVQIYADKKAFEVLDGLYPTDLLEEAKPEHFGTEFLSMKMAIKTVGSLEEALDHIAINSSKHSEAIISEDELNIETFLNRVDAAAAYVNTSTAFTDGAQFGLGAEIGISTQKLHARGPMGLEELTSYKWIVKGNGQVRKG
ncbi:glutamate-5-semialdehyde dehydrogenase [Mucilaginibacter phyllosphaerae]|uniref:Gamma-glutamyl phosphate reductase n=1 Tax=Mucilaginibacter phyllosphaerae TaxID=1812349 RepID=A0A4Y8AI57_9SPHI|nr:glutamate-5-semialdehyde dehydrogenase [Mucilaginibacter phyllosphaerae]MBB3968225.1 glutamate-5-semialdehyde dehydrogenase [Mucilaginibacter phyllosphaerae]TEW68767.1 glutamate-5-semialdehyde dehydrogenase [Mucilaginibacter phyllosphaerae]GGH00394.1 gamma-glutamyl phosphate reductase [Mucilaginibacter phyllosphaerae]